MRLLLVALALLSAGCAHRRTYIVEIHPVDRGNYAGSYTLTTGKRTKTGSFNSNGARPLRLKLRGRELSIALQNDDTKPLTIRQSVKGGRPVETQVPAGEHWQSDWN